MAVKALTFDRFDAGMDLRKGSTVTDANRATDLLNCDVTAGFAVKKRPGLVKVGEFPAGSVGLFLFGASISTFTASSIGSPVAPEKSHSVVIASGYVYAALEMSQGVVEHYYFDGTTNDESNQIILAYQQAIDAMAVYIASDYEVQFNSATLTGHKVIVLATGNDETFEPALSDSVAIVVAELEKLAALILPDVTVTASRVVADVVAALQLIANTIEGINNKSANYSVQWLSTLDGFSFRYSNFWNTGNAYIGNLKNAVLYGQDAGDVDPGAEQAFIDAFASMKSLADVRGELQTTFDAYRNIVLDSDEIDISELSGQKVVDENCPNSPMVVSLVGKLFSPSLDGTAVRFSATNNPRDWTTADDAGFLPISHNGGGRVTALAAYRGYLAVYTDSAVQIWQVDPDPAQHALIDVAHGVTSEYSRSICSVSGDVLFLGYSGIRSLSQASQTGNLSDVDIGSPIDSLIPALLKGLPDVVGHFSQSMGKFLLFFGREALVYSFSKTSKLAAWSRWVLPDAIDGAVDLMGKTYIRIGDDLYALDDDAYTDNGEPFEVRAEFGFLSMKSPGSLKRLMGMDAVVSGEGDFIIAYDERNPADEALIAQLDGDSRPGGTLPVELHGTAFSPRFRCQHDKPFQLDLLTFYYDVLGVR